MPIGNRIVVFLFIFVVIPSYPRAERSELSIIGLKVRANQLGYVTNSFNLRENFRLISTVIDWKNPKINLYFLRFLLWNLYNHVNNLPTIRNFFHSFVIILVDNILPVLFVKNVLIKFNVLDTFASFCFVRHKPSSVHRGCCRWRCG